MNTTSQQTPEETVEAYWRAYNDHDLNAMSALQAPEFKILNHVDVEGQSMSKEVYLKVCESWFKAFPDLKIELVSIFSKGDTVACEVIESGTMKAPYEIEGRSVAPTNRSYRVPWAAFFRVNAQGLIVEQGHYGERQTLFQQLGVDPQVFIPQTSTTTRTPEDTVQTFIRAFDAHDLDAALALLAPEFMGIGYHSQGQPASKEVYAKLFATVRQTFPDFKWELKSIVSTGDTVACEMVESGTFKAPYEAPGYTIAPTNRSYRIPVAAFFRVNVHGLIVEYQLYADSADAQQQVGLGPQQMASWNRATPGDWQAKATT